MLFRSIAFAMSDDYGTGGAERRTPRDAAAWSERMIAICGEWLPRRAALLLAPQLDHEDAARGMGHDVIRHAPHEQFRDTGAAV